ncbi:unnamed protein product [Orchesella dallaii]|uniref:Uncharacterized protein n=1 Tax=Orchesella dallaii TaxID=48710 RepID=A0ABP1Q454_9HEXA
MGGSNQAWVVPICEDNEIAGALLSARVIRQHSTEALVAFVKDTITAESRDNLEKIFDLVINAPRAPAANNAKNIRDILLLQLLNLTTFNSLLVILPGVLVFRSFTHILEQTSGILTNKAGYWKVCCVTPNKVKYQHALQAIKSGQEIDISFIKNESRRSAGSCGSSTVNSEEETVISWSDLKFYTGERMPFIEVNSDFINSGLNQNEVEDFNRGSEAEGFWQKALLQNLALVKLEPFVHPPEEDECRSWVAVVGMSCRFPEANSIEEFWKVLNFSRNTTSSPPANRHGKHSFSPEVKANFLKCPVDEFDASFFGFPPTEAAITDPQARLLLEVSWEAFEDAGINPEMLRNKPVGVFYGSWIQEYRDLLHNTGNGFLRKYIGNSFGCSSAKISFFYGFTGPNIATESGCSSSSIAVEMACENLKNGKCPLAIAAGSNIILQMDPNSKVVWAEDGVCKTFDSKANGYGRGEGVAVLLLKRYSDARRDGDRIHGIIRGTASSQEGLSKSFGTPTIESESRAMKKAMEAAGVGPNDVDYVEAHATGTGVGDPIEAEAIVKAYSSLTGQRQSPLLIGSVKTNIGHTESCSGIAAIIKVLLAMKHELIPPHLNVETINPKVDFTPIPGEICLKSQVWKRSPNRPRIAGVSNFGITGTDVHMIIQEPPKPIQAETTSPSKHPIHILTFSAKTMAALEQLSQLYIEFLEKETEINIEDIIYTANVCRAHHPLRKAVFGTDKEELLFQLRQEKPQLHLQKNSKKLAFICRDQFLCNGNHFNKYSLLYSTFLVFQMHVDMCGAILKDNFGQDFLNISSILNNQIEPTLSNIDRKFLTLSFSYSLCKLWDSWGVKADYVVGIGELGKLVGSVFTGQLSLEQGFKAIKEGISYSELRKNVHKSGITFISCKDEAQLESELAEMLKLDSLALIEIGLEGKLHTLVGPDNLSCLHVPENANNCVVQKTKTLAHVFAALASLYEGGFDINWEGFYGYENHSRKKVALPHYPFQRKSFWFEKEQEEAAQSQVLSIQNQFWKQIHPLLGNYVVPSSPASVETESHIFQTDLIAQYQAPYLLDHKIGPEMIFPAAAFIEMLLAANNFQGRTRAQAQESQAHILENFQVHLPLHLEMCNEKKLKTVMNCPQAFVEGEDTTHLNFKRYASGEMNNGKEESIIVLHDIQKIKNRTVLDEHLSSKVYSKFDDVGLKFGENFRSLQDIYLNSETGESLATVSIPEDAVHYISHPILTDAMIQAYMVAKHPNETRLHVPVSVRKFVVFRRLSPQECSLKSRLYIYFKNSNSSMDLEPESDTVFLLDSDGSPVALMFGIVLTATNINTILSAAGIPTNKIDYKDRPVDTYQVVWKHAKTYHNEVEFSLEPHLATDFTQTPGYTSLIESLKQQNHFTRKEKELEENVNRLCELYVLKALYDIGWEGKVNQEIDVDKLATQLQIASAFFPAFQQYLSYFVGNGYRNALDSKESVEDSIRKLLNNPTLKNYEPIPLIQKCGSQLSAVLQGKMKSVQNFLLTIRDEETNSNGLTPLESYQQLNLYHRSAGLAAPNVILEVPKHFHYSSKKPKATLRILEVGGGSDFFAREVLSLFDEEGIQIMYYYTDISFPVLKKFKEGWGSEYEKRVIFKPLDIEEDPLNQGFSPGYFDVVVTSNVLHLTKNLKKCVGHCQILLKEGGVIIISETNRPIKEVDLVFGSLQEYWEFTDKDLRRTHPIILGEQWMKLLKENGFSGPSFNIALAENNLCVVVGTKNQDGCGLSLAKTVDEHKAWILLHDLEQNSPLLQGMSKRMSMLGRTLHSHRVDMENFSQIILNNGSDYEGILCVFEGKDDSLASINCRVFLEPLLLTVQHVTRKKGRLPKFCVATFGVCKLQEESFAGCPTIAPVWGFIRCVKQEILGLVSKLVDLDPHEEKIEDNLNFLMQEMWNDDGETEVMYREGFRYIRRLENDNLNEFPSHDLLTFPSELTDLDTDRRDYTVKLPESNLLSDLTYIPKKIGEVGESQVVVEVRATSLNFKDVLNVMKPSDFFKGMNTIGLDFSGVVTLIGEKVDGLTVGTPVFGMSCVQSTISGYIKAEAQHLEVIPPTLTFAEAATLPVAFLTAWYCIVDVAQAKSGQTVLIHAASGGVGLVAVQIAKYLGLNIVVTAGNPKKRNYLKELGINHLFNSRTLEYGEKIKEVTQSQGVDIVLNCLTGPGFKETSLEVCKVGGFFVEISKLDIWEEEEVKQRKPGVNYEVVDLTTVESEKVSCLWRKLATLLEEGFIKPLPFRSYTASRLVDALKFLQKAKHIGKVIVEMPRFDREKGIWRDFLFNDRSSYLITGGKGAIGLAIAEWMVSQGAKYIVLVGRGPPKENALQIIHKLENEARVRVICKEADIANYDDCRMLLNEIEEDCTLPQLRGIHHCAGLVSDAMITHQTWENFENVLNPKVKGAFNMHTLTLNYPLEHFVVHSSLTYTIGNPGQSNYATANAYMESLVDRRHWMGLPAMSLSWGQWNAGVAENLELDHFAPFSVAQGIATLEMAFLENRVNVWAGFLNFGKYVKLFPPYEKTLFEEIFADSLNMKYDNITGSGGFKKAKQSLAEIYYKADGEGEQESLIKGFIKQGLSDILGIQLVELEEGVLFSQMGMDSLLSIEFYNRLQSEMGNVDLGYIDMELDGTVEKISIIVKTAFASNAMSTIN